MASFSYDIYREYLPKSAWRMGNDCLARYLVFGIWYCGIRWNDHVMLFVRFMDEERSQIEFYHIGGIEASKVTIEVMAAETFMHLGFAPLRYLNKVIDTK